MRKIKLLIVLFSISLYANSFETNCKTCHFQQMQLHMFMNKYTLRYSSERLIKKAMYDYLKNPTESNSVMPKGFLFRFGIKKPTTLSDEELNASIDAYIKEYNIKNFIK